MLIKLLFIILSLVSSSFASDVSLNLGVIFKSESVEQWASESFKWQMIESFSKQTKIQLNLSSDLQVHKCELNDHNCFYQSMLKDKLDALVIGDVEKGKIHYKILDAKRRTVTFEKGIRISSSIGPNYLQVEALKSLKPYLEKGGYLDQLNSNDSKEASKYKKKNIVIYFLFVFMALMIPFLLSLYLKVSESPFFENFKRLYLAYTLSLTCFVIFLVFFHERFEYLKNVKGVSELLSGFIWSYLLIISLRIIFPSLSRIEKVKTSSIKEFFRSFFILSFVKSLLVMSAWVVSYFLIIKLMKELDLSTNVQASIFIPFSLFHLWVCSQLILEVVALYYDTVLKVLKADNVWSEHIKKYFIGYLKRGKINFNSALIDDVRFVTGEFEHVSHETYGSYLFPQRAYVSKKLLETCFKAEPYQRDSSINILLRDSTLGSLLNLSEKKEYNSIKSKFISMKRKKVLSEFDDSEDDFNYHDFSYIRELDNELLGLIQPKFSTYSGDEISLISDDEEDLAIVEELMTEHRKELDKPVEQLEVDDTNPTDRDFMFGLIMLRFASLKNSQYLWSMITYGFHALRRTMKIPWNDDFFKTPLLSKHRQRLESFFCLFHESAHHLYQTYYYFSFKKKRPLSKRASNLELQRNLEDMHELVSGIEDQDKPFFSEMNWIYKSIHSDKEKLKEPRKDFYLWLSIPLALGLLVLSIDSYLYTNKYNDYLKSEKTRIEKLKEKIEKRKKRNGKNR